MLFPQSRQLQPVAHRTEYAGHVFRSRLEARWAAFFDICGWRWEYEPCDCEGWVPDFNLIGARTVIPVEVKPINWRGDVGQMVRDATVRPDLEKVRRSRGAEVLILGAYPASWRVCPVSLAPALGLIKEGDPEWEGRLFDAAALRPGRNGGELDFCGARGSTELRMGGETDTRLGAHAEISHVRRLWGHANAATQWNPPAMAA